MVTEEGEDCWLAMQKGQQVCSLCMFTLLSYETFESERNFVKWLVSLLDGVM